MHSIYISINLHANKSEYELNITVRLRLARSSVSDGISKSFTLSAILSNDSFNVIFNESSYSSAIIRHQKFLIKISATPVRRGSSSLLLCVNDSCSFSAIMFVVDIFRHEMNLEIVIKNATIVICFYDKPNTFNLNKRKLLRLHKKIISMLIDETDCCCCCC
ncbi:hypothetical protein DERF_014903 [Dermatophagoides farinae]|uniref:Uncharacterized protein n=1 Tax=Dermatophagoides farinae TaxID=6954 RepID=A0A922HJZ8_DERFA|nr:hypothetical protein DERF_014903 [Dermatophagoides farinae]